MGNSAKQFHCPNCNADLKFSPDVQKFTCEYCKGEFTEQQVNDYMEKQQEIYDEYYQGADHIPPEGEVSQEELNERAAFEEESRLYSCPSCGAEIVSDENTAASFCYYCHNPVILKGRVDGQYKPSMVLPFTLDRDKAVDIFKTWAKGKLFAPKDLTSAMQIEKLTGLYVPFWVANSSTSSHVEAYCENYRRWTSGEYRYTETSRYKVERDITVNYEGIPADGSKKIEDALMESIEPFDYKQAKPFNMAYLSGFFADKYDVDKERMLPRIKERMFANNKTVADGTIHYQAVKSRHQKDKINTLSWRYMLLPVWFMTFSYDGKMWEYAINGQTGKIAGELPISTKKLLIGCILAGLAAAALIFGGGYLFR